MAGIAPARWRLGCVCRFRDCTLCVLAESNLALTMFTQKDFIWDR